MANLCIKTPSSASWVLIFQLLVLRPRPNEQVMYVEHFILESDWVVSMCAQFFLLRAMLHMIYVVVHQSACKNLAIHQTTDFLEWSWMFLRDLDSIGHTGCPILQYVPKHSLIVDWETGLSSNDGVDWIESHAVVEGIHPWTAARWSEEPGTISTCNIFSTISTIFSTIVSWVRYQVPPQDPFVFVGSSETCKAFHMKSHHLCLSSEVSFDSFGLSHIFDETIPQKNYPGQKSDFKNKR